MLCDSGICENRIRTHIIYSLFCFCVHFFFLVLHCLILLQRHQPHTKNTDYKIERWVHPKTAAPRTLVYCVFFALEQQRKTEHTPSDRDRTSHFRVQKLTTPWTLIIKYDDINTAHECYILLFFLFCIFLLLFVPFMNFSM